MPEFAQKAAYTKRQCALNLAASLIAESEAKRALKYLKLATPPSSHKELKGAGRDSPSNGDLHYNMGLAYATLLLLLRIHSFSQSSRTDCYCVLLLFFDSARAASISWAISRAQRITCVCNMLCSVQFSSVPFSAECVVYVYRTFFRLTRRNGARGISDVRALERRTGTLCYAMLRCELQSNTNRILYTVLY